MEKIAPEMHAEYLRQLRQQRGDPQGNEAEIDVNALLDIAEMLRNQRDRENADE